MKAPTLRIILAALAVGSFAACGAPGITEPTPSAVSTEAQLNLEPSLVECPTSESISSTTLVTPLGGMVSAGGTTISIPAGAVLLPATVTVTVPASNYMEVDISVEGSEHFMFHSPVTITVSYARCTRANIDKAPLSVWYIDSATKSLLEFMGGLDDKLAREITFTTDHLSGYALAN